MPLSLLLIDDHPLFLEGMASVLRRFDSDVRVVLAANAEAGLCAAERENVDLVLLDLSLPGIDGIGAIGEFRRRLPSVPVVILSASEREEDIHGAINRGALGFIPKSSSTKQLFAALQHVLAGNVYTPTRELTQTGLTIDRPDRPDTLSLRQMEVLALLCLGNSNKLIAQEMSLSEKTVKAHVTAIFRSLGVVNRTQAVLAAKRLGLCAS